MSVNTQPNTIREARSRILSEIGEGTVLVAASKRQPDERIDAALEYGKKCLRDVFVLFH